MVAVCFLSLVEHEMFRPLHRLAWFVRMRPLLERVTEPTHATATADGDRLAATLKPAQRRVLADLGAREAGELTRADYERIGCVSRSQAAYDLAELVKIGLLERHGSGRATHYRLADPRSGRKRKWTEARIRAELAEFCAELAEWPRAGDFKREGRGDLYLAASRHGGIERWAAELGYREPHATKPARGATVDNRGRRLRVAAFGVVLAVAAAVAVVRASVDESAPTGKAEVAASLGSPAADRSTFAATERATPPARTTKVRFAATGQRSWLVVRRGSAAGKLLFAGAVRPGHAVRFRALPLWLRLNAPWALRGRLNGRTLTLPRTRSIVLVTARGVRVVRRLAPPPPPATTSSGDAALVFDSGADGSGATSGATPPALSPPAPPPPAPPPAPPPPAQQPSRPAPDERPPPGAPGPDLPPGG